MSPRKSSTSSGRAPTRRPRYLGLVAQRDGPGSFSLRDWEALLRHRLVVADVPRVRFRLVRSSGARALVEVDHLEVALALAAWLPRTGSGGDTGPELRTVRTWGTLRGAKIWLSTAAHTGPDREG